MNRIKLVITYDSSDGTQQQMVMYGDHDEMLERASQLHGLVIVRNLELVEES